MNKLTDKERARLCAAFTGLVFGLALALALWAVRHAHGWP